ncbi:hypothetical protein [Listeria fleischmannii]|uniref:hypothetical protein n=1 Tax=Listeria fleischmannii TaxID=1069827 RepID=UPI000E0EA796|nr:hypothetical protein [Listeria fleischmannii]
MFVTIENGIKYGMEKILKVFYVEEYQTGKWKKKAYTKCLCDKGKAFQDREKEGMKHGSR